MILIDGGRYGTTIRTNDPKRVEAFVKAHKQAHGIDLENKSLKKSFFRKIIEKICFCS